MTIGVIQQAAFQANQKMLMSNHKNVHALVLFGILAISTILILYMYPLSNLLQRRLPPKRSQEMVTTSTLRDVVSTAAQAENINNSIVVLVYTTFWGAGSMWFNLNGDCSLSGKRKTSCKKDKLEITYDKQRFKESDFLVFHANDMPNLDHLTSINKDKPSSQLWIYYTMESPYITPDTTPLNGMFDLTYTYRCDSDFWAPYGHYAEIPFANSAQQDFSVGKDKLVSWMVSNCRPQLRASFVRELQKYIAVDVFGKCSGEFGPYRPACLRGQACIKMHKQYKFYLSIENSLCEDYITEKYWWHLGEDNVIPIVMGGANYTKLAIPESYINVMDFKTVKDLADYLHYLDKNSTAYNEYFKWRQRYQRSDVPGYCSFCEAVTSNTRINTKVYKDLRDYWVTQGKCGEKDQIIRNMWNS